MRTNLRDSLKGIKISGKAKIIERNTFRYIDENGDTKIRLHNTDIITKTISGKTILNSGGYQSKTTKERMDGYSGYRISQRQGIWYVSGDNKTVTYYDGIVLPDALDSPENDKAGESLALIKKINKFCDKIKRGKHWPMPDSGDCFICAMKDKDGNQCLEHDRAGHLLGHIEEGYLHGSLIVNAMLARGYGRQAIGMFYNNPRLNDTVKRGLRKYLKKALGLPS